MNLDNREVEVQYSPLRTSPPVLAEVAKQARFPAMVKAIQDGDPDDADGGGVKVTIEVKGMTCMSCVRNIESNVGKRAGVLSISVSLKEELARLVIDPNQISPADAAEAIDDMGFDAVLLSPLNAQDQTGPSPAAATRVARICVEGMVCQSCVKNIEGNISTKPGVLDIKVSLNDKQAVVNFDPALTSAAAVTEQIDDMGFDATLDGEEAPSTGFTLVNLGEDFAKTGKPSPANTNSSPSKGHKILLSIRGMTCHSCVKNIEGRLGEHPGVSSGTVSLSDQQAAVEYNPLLVSPEQLCTLITDDKFTATVKGK